MWDLAVYQGAIHAAGQVAVGTPGEPWRDLEAVVARLTPGGSLAWAHVFRDPGIQDDWDSAVSITVADGRPVAAIQMNGTTGAWTRLVGLRAGTGAVRWSAGTDGWPSVVEGNVHRHVVPRRPSPGDLHPSGVRTTRRSPLVLG